MASFILSCCSTADLSREHFQNRDIHYICFHYELDGKPYPDDLGQTIPFDQFYQAMVDGADTRTSQINAEEYAEYFEGFLKEGKDVLHLCLSSGISGSINSARLAQQELATASPEDNKLIYDDLVASSGVEILFRTTVCAVEREGSRITGIITSGKDGLTAYRAKTFIDCTGDADLCFFAGLEFEKGDTDGSLQAATLCFIITGINPDAYAKLTMYGGSEKSPIHRILSTGKWPLIKDGHFLVDVLAPGTIGFNAGHLWDSDGTNPAQFTKSMLLGRKLAREFRDALAELEPEAFGESYLVLTAPTLGVRETRRIRGEYTLTLDDYIARRTFDDEIARNCYFIDLHSSDPASDSHTEDAKYAHCQYQPGESHGIPYRCLIPQGMDNLLVAGRSISCDRAVMGSIRVMPNCLTTGEAAGTAAALAVQQGTDTKHLDISLLRNTLRQNGAYFL